MVPKHPKLCFNKAAIPGMYTNASKVLTTTLQSLSVTNVIEYIVDTKSNIIPCNVGK